MRLRQIAAVCAFVLAVTIAASPLSAQGIGAVRVTSATANIRSEGKDTAPVITQVKAGTVLQLQAIEGDWFRVQLAPDPRLGGARVEAYISKKVAKLEPGSPTAASPKPAEPPPPPKEPESRDGMSVTLESKNTSTFLTPRPVAVVQMPAKSDNSVGELAAAMRADGAPPATGAAQVVYAWTMVGAASPRVVDDKHPGFIVLFKDVAGLRPEDLAPVLVRLSPSPTDARVIALARGRADQSKRGDADWDLMKALKQDVVRAEVDIVGRGVARVRPVADLPPGEYAIVLRPVDAKRKFAGAMVLGADAEARVFGAAWDFSIK